MLLTPLSSLLETEKPGAEQGEDSKLEGAGTTDDSHEAGEEDTDQHPPP
jgi:hypothetical protein